MAYQPAPSAPIMGYAGAPPMQQMQPGMYPNPAMGQPPDDGTAGCDAGSSSDCTWRSAACAVDAAYFVRSELPSGTRIPRDG